MLLEHLTQFWTLHCTQEVFKLFGTRVKVELVEQVWQMLAEEQAVQFAMLHIIQLFEVS